MILVRLVGGDEVEGLKALRQRGWETKNGLLYAPLEYVLIARR